MAQWVRMIAGKAGEYEFKCPAPIKKNMPVTQCCTWRWADPRYWVPSQHSESGELQVQ